MNSLVTKQEITPFWTCWTTKVNKKDICERVTYLPRLTFVFTPNIYKLAKHYSSTEIIRTYVKMMKNDEKWWKMIKNDKQSERVLKIGLHLSFIDNSFWLFFHSRWVWLSKICISRKFSGISNYRKK